MVASGKQVNLEKEMAAVGKTRYVNSLNEKRAKGRETDTGAGRYLLREATEKFALELRRWLRKAHSNIGVHHAAAGMLEGFRPEAVAFLAGRSILDTLAARSSLIAVALGVGDVLEAEHKWDSVADQAPDAFRIDLMNMKRQQASPRRRRRLAREAVKAHGVAHEAWLKKDRIRLGVTLIELFRLSTGLIEFGSHFMPSGRKQTIVVPTLAALEWLEKAHDHQAILKPFYMPCVEQPAPWTTPYDGGYFTHELKRRPLIKASRKESLKELERADMPEVYEAVNNLQGTAWRVNDRVHRVMREMIAGGSDLGGLGRRDPMPIPPKPADMLTNPEVNSQWRRDAAKIHVANIGERSRRLLSAKIMFMADRMGHQAFYFPHEVDFRGRVYPTPYFLQPQGPGQSRGLLEFHTACPITTPEQLDWLHIQGSNAYGVDKVSLAERLRWVRDNRLAIIECAEKPLIETFWHKADKPWEFLAFCFEFADMGKQGYGFKSRLPVFMDGSNNGLQIYSMIMRDERSAASTNCRALPYPRDVYQDVADLVTQKLVSEVRPEFVHMAAEWIAHCGGAVSRATTKRAVMTVPYGLTFHTCARYIHDWHDENARATGKRVTEKAFPHCRYLAALVWESINETISTARACMNWMREVAGVLEEQGLPVRWTTPTGFPVTQAYFKYKSRKIDTAVEGIVRWVRYREDTADVSRQRQANGVAPNFVHSLDAACLVRTVNACFQQGVPAFAAIHDSFGVHAAYAPLTARLLREAYVGVFSENPLERFAEECKLYLPPGVALPEIPRGGDFDITEVLRSDYFFA